MSKAELIDAVAAGANISKAVAASAIESFTGSITETLKRGGKSLSLVLERSLFQRGKPEQAVIPGPESPQKYLHQKLRNFLLEKP